MDPGSAPGHSMSHDPDRLIQIVARGHSVILSIRVQAGDHRTRLASETRPFRLTYTGSSRVTHGIPLRMTTVPVKAMALRYAPV